MARFEPDFGIRTALGIRIVNTLAFGNTRYTGCRREWKEMKSPVSDMLGVEFPLFAFSHCRDVVAAVSRAGGFGVVGATGHTADSGRTELKWMDDHVGGKPYGLDVLMPENMATAGETNVTYNSL